MLTCYVRACALCLCMSSQIEGLVDLPPFYPFLTLLHFGKGRTVLFYLHMDCFFQGLCGAILKKKKKKKKNEFVLMKCFFAVSPSLNSPVIACLNGVTKICGRGLYLVELQMLWDPGQLLLHEILLSSLYFATVELIV